MADVQPYWKNYTDGAWGAGGAGRIDVTDPATGERIAEHALANAADVDRAVQAARRVHLSGALTAMRPIERGRMVQAIGRNLLAHKDEPGIERTEFGANMGSMVSDGQRDRALGMITRAEEQGARIAAGGRKPNRPGAFLEPTVLSDVTPDMEIARQEVFGPVLSVLSFREDAQAIEIANSTDDGLVAGVFTADLDRATRAARHLRAGQVFVNEWYAGGVETPFGGYGKSGYGREKGREALWNYVQTKNIAIRLKG